MNDQQTVLTLLGSDKSLGCCDSAGVTLEICDDLIRKDKLSETIQQSVSRYQKRLVTHLVAGVGTGQEDTRRSTSQRRGNAGCTTLRSRNKRRNGLFLTKPRITMSA